MTSRGLENMLHEPAFPLDNQPSIRMAIVQPLQQKFNTTAARASKKRRFLRPRDETDTFVHSVAIVATDPDPANPAIDSYVLIQLKESQLGNPGIRVQLVPPEVLQRWIEDPKDPDNNSRHDPVFRSFINALSKVFQDSNETKKLFATVFNDASNFLALDGSLEALKTKLIDQNKIDTLNLWGEVPDRDLVGVHQLITSAALNIHNLIAKIGESIRQATSASFAADDYAKAWVRSALNEYIRILDILNKEIQYRRQFSRTFLSHQNLLRTILANAREVLQLTRSSQQPQISPANSESPAAVLAADTRHVSGSPSERPGIAEQTTREENSEGNAEPGSPGKDPERRIAGSRHLSPDGNRSVTDSLLPRVQAVANSPNEQIPPAAWRRPDLVAPGEAVTPGPPSQDGPRDGGAPISPRPSHRQPQAGRLNIEIVRPAPVETPSSSPKDPPKDPRPDKFVFLPLRGTTLGMPSMRIKRIPGAPKRERTWEEIEEKAKRCAFSRQTNEGPSRQQKIKRTKAAANRSKTAGTNLAPGECLEAFNYALLKGTAQRVGSLMGRNSSSLFFDKLPHNWARLEESQQFLSLAHALAS